MIFVSCTGDNAAASGLANLKNIFPYTYESRYVSGVVAGMKLKELLDAGTVTDPYVGYVGAYPYAEVVSGYTAFFLGIRSIVPEAHMDVQYTQSWYDPAKESEAANALMARGCVIIGQHADSTGAPSAVQAALDGGKTAYSVGYNVDMLSVAPRRRPDLRPERLVRPVPDHPGQVPQGRGDPRRLCYRHQGRRRVHLRAGPVLRRGHRREGGRGLGRPEGRQPQHL